VPPKPHRVLQRVSGYADEAAAFLRRRRHLRKPFARVYYVDGRCLSHPRETDQGSALFDAAAAVIEVSGSPRRQRRSATPT
jgi:hypothetical protein